MTSYLVGIDLGTSNSALAWAEAGSEHIELLGVEQLVGPGQLASPPLLPSLRYHPAAGELDAAALRLPWDEAPEAVVGRFAGELGAKVPGRLVASAKSWLSHAGVDREAPILPWGGEADAAKISPLDASAGYLAHLRAAWNARFPTSPLERQRVVLTVPASFDEGARALTVEAARRAGLGEPRLLEEPQAALYDWLFRHREDPAAALGEARLVLVCDVGGGTTDFSLVRVDAGARLTRIGVGDHLMLGGDNMDLALAHLAESRLSGEGRLSAAGFAQLVQQCRAAKERLLTTDAPAEATVTVLGGGARLIGAARSASLAREEVERLVLDGFFPREGPDARPRRRRSGIVEFGLPYPAEPAITRHLAAFLERHADAARAALGEAAPPEGALPVPDTLLLNGGAFRAAALAGRLQEILARWRGAPLRLLANEAPETAVACGAVASALLRDAPGRTIGGGAARSYFLALEETGRGICVLPRGTPEGQVVELPGRHFALRLGQAVRFHLVSSTGDAPRRPGELIELADEGGVRLPPLAAVLPPPEGRRRAEETVRVVTEITELGTLQMHCIALEDAHRRWRLDFELRGRAMAERTSPAPRLDEALAAIERIFGGKKQSVESKEVRQLRARLERLLGPRDDWGLSLLRALYDALWEGARRRRRSAEHERLWLNLAGYCLRPGTGAALDDWRTGQLWPIFADGIQYAGENRNWSEWWTLWRRAAGGLGETEQLAVLEVLAGHLEHADARRRDPVQRSYDDMVRLAAALERVPVMHRIEVGRWLLERLARADESPHTWSALGRVGAREPLYGSAHTVVPPETAAQWLEAVLALDWKAVEPAAFAAARIARLTGDRARDLPEALRDEVARRLEAIRAPAGWIAMVREATPMAEEERQRSFGEALPAGLTLIGG